MSIELEELKAQLKELQERTGKTNLPAYLHACHEYLFRGLTIQDAASSTTGNPANADKKTRPRRIEINEAFAGEQKQVWHAIAESGVMEQKLFTSLNTLEESGASLPKIVGSEADLHSFSNEAVLRPVAAIVEALAQNHSLRHEFQLDGTIRFENHTNMLNADNIPPARGAINIPTRPRRQSPRLRKQDEGAESSLPLVRRGTTPPVKGSRLRADLFCVQTMSADTDGFSRRKVVLVMELKPPHKLPLGDICMGLEGGIDVDDIIQEQHEESLKRRCSRLVAAVITQAFSYMIRGGHDRGVAYTGEAILFLTIPSNPDTVHVALAAPLRDVGDHTGWTAACDGLNRLDLTAVAQLTAFIVGGFRPRDRDSRWRRQVEELPMWEVVVEQLEDAILKEERPSSEYRPPSKTQLDFRDSPIQLRKRKNLSEPEPLQHIFRRGDEDHTDDEEEEEGGGGGGGGGGGNNSGGQETPSRPPQKPLGATRSSTGKVTRGGQTQSTSKGGNSRQVDLGPSCSPACLKALVRGTPLDPSCPNANTHRKHNRVNATRFRQLVDHLLRHQRDFVEELPAFGSFGVLYRIRLPKYGYTFLAKGTHSGYAHDLENEGRVYKYMEDMQGDIIPVYLGIFTVAQPFYYQGVVPVVRMMMLSFAGHKASVSSMPLSWKERAIKGIDAMEERGVFHADLLSRDGWERNLLNHPILMQPFWIDFGKAKIIDRPALRPLSNNQISTTTKKRKAAPDTHTADRLKEEYRYVRRCLMPP